MRTTFLSFALFLFSTILFAQEKNQGNIQIIQDAQVDSLMQMFIKKNEVHPEIKGFRIEIYFEAGTNSKQKALEAKSGFVEVFPEVSSYLLFQQPYYKVRIGDFRTKMEAETFLKQIEKEYPNAFVVPDEINFPPLD